jgi:hypothetical protein
LNLSPEVELIESIKVATNVRGAALEERQAPRDTSDREGDTIAAIGRMMIELDQEARERVALWTAGKYGA